MIDIEEVFLLIRYEVVRVWVGVLFFSVNSIYFSGKFSLVLGFNFFMYLFKFCFISERI